MNQADQQQQFGQWVREHGAILHHVVNGFASGDDRNDLMQELMLALWKAVPAFRRDAQPSTFIYRVSHNAAMTWQRTQRNYRRKVEQFGALAPAEASADHDSGRESLERLYSEIRRLGALDRSLILLSLDGVSYREMAAIHGLSESNVGVRLTRLKQKLATAMKEERHEL